MTSHITNAFDQYVVQGGIMMITLIPCLVLMVAFVIQSILNLRRARIAPEEFPKRLLEARRQGPEPLGTVLEGADHSLGEIVRNVRGHLEFHRSADPAEVLREEIGSECDLLLQQNSQLGVIYRVAPQLGLLGTVFGMISTFNAFAVSTNPDVQELSKGINVALITTAWGLSIAIPAYITHYLVQRRIIHYEQFVLPRLGATALHALLDRPVTSTSGAELRRLSLDSIPATIQADNE
jgi:biopolymer transport protein ExbB